MNEHQLVESLAFLPVPVKKGELEYLKPKIQAIIHPDSKSLPEYNPQKVILKGFILMARKFYSGGWEEI